MHIINDLDCLKAVSGAEFAFLSKQDVAMVNLAYSLGWGSLLACAFVSVSPLGIIGTVAGGLTAATLGLGIGYVSSPYFGVEPNHWYDVNPNTHTIYGMYNT